MIFKLWKIMNRNYSCWKINYDICDYVLYSNQINNHFEIYIENYFIKINKKMIIITNKKIFKIFNFSYDNFINKKKKNDNENNWTIKRLVLIYK